MNVRIARWLLCLALTALLCACGGSQNAAPSSVKGTLTLAWTPEYVGVANGSCTVFTECLRPPAYNLDVPVSQPGNVSSFSVSSADSSIATGSIEMTGPGGQSDPAVAVNARKAGNTVLTVTGANGSSATLPVTVTTISTLRVTLNGLPSAAFLEFTVGAQPGAQCPSFEGGYSFEWGTSAPPAVTTLQNFPAMGAGPLSGCAFSNVVVSVTDASNKTLATKTFHLPIVVGVDNPTTIAIP